jgi:hypothetical protein
MPELDVRATAAHCRHYAMCKIDYLGTGVCASGPERAFVTFYPQGRMDLYHALATGQVPVTAGVLESADTCTLCGSCDAQCSFCTELRPVKVMEALKDLVAAHRASGATAAPVLADPFVDEVAAIVGAAWVTSDPAHLVAYSHDPCPIAPPRLPRAVACPGTEQEIVALLRLCAARGIPYALRGNGSSVMGFVMSEGLVLDFNRMRRIEFDEANWCVRVGPGVSAFDLQRAARVRGYRVNTAEPAALICANIMCSGIFSTFSAAYGISADNLVSARFVGPDGVAFSLHDPGAPNLWGYRKADVPSPGVCVEAAVKLHPVLPDEEGLLVPCGTLADALELARELAVRRIGLAIGVLGGEYISTFLAPTAELARGLKSLFAETLGIGYLVLVIGDTHARNAVRAIRPEVIDQSLFSDLFLGLPNLVDSEWTDLVAGLAGDGAPWAFLAKPELRPLLQAALRPSPGAHAAAVPADLRPVYERFYADPAHVDLAWLNEFRILSSRMGREKHVVAFIVYVPMDAALIVEMDAAFAAAADKFGVKRDFGFVTPLDAGRRAVYEYDYYLDQTDEAEIGAMRGAIMEAAGMIEGFSATRPGVRWIRYTLNQGCARKEHFLYLP